MAIVWKRPSQYIFTHHFLLMRCFYLIHPKNCAYRSPFVAFCCVMVSLVPTHNHQTLQWHHNERDGVSWNHRRFDCLLNHLLRRRSKKMSKLRVIVLCKGIHRRPVDSPHKGPVMRKMFPFGVIKITSRTMDWEYVKAILNDNRTKTLQGKTDSCTYFMIVKWTCSITMKRMICYKIAEDIDK